MELVKPILALIGLAGAVIGGKAPLRNERATHSAGHVTLPIKQSEMEECRRYDIEDLLLP